MAARYRRARQSVDFWPGYVDGLAGLLMMMLFLLLFYVLGELVYSTALDSSEQESESKSNVINDLLSQLSLAEDYNTNLENQVQSQRQDIQNLLDIQKDKTEEISALTLIRDAQIANLQELNAAFSNLQQQADATINEQETQLGLLSTALEEERLRLAEILLTLKQRDTDLSKTEIALNLSDENLTTAQNTLSLREETLNQTEQTLQVRMQELATLITERDALKEAFANAKAALGETITTQADKILVLEQNIDEIDRLNAAQKTQIQSLSDEQVLLVGRIADFEKIEQQRINTLASLNNDIAVLQVLRTKLQDQLGAQNTELDKKDRSLLQALAEMKRLSSQIGDLNSQLKEINTILSVREAQIEEQNLSLENLGQRLNIALASEVQRLQRYRSDFFERMGQVLANSPKIKIIDDRFVLQSEVLFPSSSAELSSGGREQLEDIAKTLLKVLDDAPSDLSWILRIDGHTDNRPINTAQFPSNWELSSARAIAVVRYLSELGIPETRLAATGFAHLHPVENRDDEIAHRRNRRIEMKLTQR